VACGSQPESSVEPSDAAALSGRRTALLAAGAALLAWPTRPAHALPLAPLGSVEHVGGDKLVGSTPEQIKVGAGARPGTRAPMRHAAEPAAPPPPPPFTPTVLDPGAGHPDA
jgi:hypothetical protein